MQLFRAAGAGRERQGMEDPAPADPPRIFWKSRRSGACYPNSYLQNLADFLVPSYPRDRFLVTHPFLSIFPLLESWLISVQFSANFCNSSQKEIIQVIEQLNSHLNTVISATLLPSEHFPSVFISFGTDAPECAGEIFRVRINDRQLTRVVWLD